MILKIESQRYIKENGACAELPAKVALILEVQKACSISVLHVR